MRGAATESALRRTGMQNVRTQADARAAGVLACRPGRGFRGAVPAIGNEPSRNILPVVSAVLVRPPHIAQFLAFPALGAPDCNGWPRGRSGWGCEWGREEVRSGYSKCGSGAPEAPEGRGEDEPPLGRHEHAGAQDLVPVQGFQGRCRHSRDRDFLLIPEYPGLKAQSAAAESRRRGWCR
jgi:hypothetical protein